MPQTQDIKIQGVKHHDVQNHVQIYAVATEYVRKIEHVSVNQIILEKVVKHDVVQIIAMVKIMAYVLI